jgi:hypothetical protein
MPKKKTGQRKKADKQKARQKEIRNKGIISNEEQSCTNHVYNLHKITALQFISFEIFGADF